MYVPIFIHNIYQGYDDIKRSFILAENVIRKSLKETPRVIHYIKLFSSSNLALFGDITI